MKYKVKRPLHKKFYITTKKVEFTITCGWYPTSTFVLFDLALFHWAGERAKAFDVYLIGLSIAKFNFTINMGSPQWNEPRRKIHVCETCKYKMTKAYVEPCLSCDCWDNWEPEPKPKRKLFRRIQ